MTTWLDRWRAMPSYRATLPLCPVYRSKATGREDIDLAALCAVERTLTLEPGRGFAEFEVKGVVDEMPEQWRYLAGALPKIPGTVSAAAIACVLVLKLEMYLVRHWDSERRKVMFCSGGLDSRIIAWLLAGLRDNLGRHWLGDITFVCHHPEGEQFRAAMRQMGWREDEYRVHRPARPQDADYYDLGDFRRNANGYYGLTWTFWQDIITPDEEQDAVLITAGFGGEVLNYPLRQGVEPNRFAAAFLLLDQPLLGGLWGRLYLNWHDVLTPFLGYEYLDVALRLPAECFVRAPGLRTTRRRQPDLMRLLMLEEASGLPAAWHAPVHWGHRYDFTVSRKRAAYLRDCWHSSSLYRDYGHLDWVKAATPYIPTSTRMVLFGQDSRLYSYATMYEHVHRGDRIEQ